MKFSVSVIYFPFSPSSFIVIVKKHEEDVQTTNLLLFEPPQMLQKSFSTYKTFIPPEGVQRQIIQQMY